MNDENKEYSTMGLNSLSKILVWIPYQRVPYENAVNYLGLNRLSNEVYQKIGIMAGGLATVGVGAAVATIGTGLIPVVLGSAITGTGYSLTVVPLMKLYSGDSINGKELGKDAAYGAVLGSIVGPIGYGGNELVKGASSSISKFATRTLVNSGAGAISKACMEGVRYMHGGTVTFGSFIKSLSQGAIVGSLAGATTYVVNGSSVAIRILTQGLTTAATDAGIQQHEKGEIDLKQTTMTTIGQLIVSTASETASSIVQKTETYSKKINNENIERDVKNGKLTEADGVKYKEIIKDLNKNVPIDLKTQKRFGEYQAHKLYDRPNSKRDGQIAFNPEGKQSSTRGIAEKINGKYVYLDKTADHNYKECRDTNKGNLTNPVDTLKPTKIASLVKQSEEGDVDNLNNNAKKIFNFGFIYTYLRSKL